MNKIVKLSRRLKIFFTIVLLVMPIILIATWINPMPGFNFLPDGTNLNDILVSTKFYGFLVSCLPIGLDMAILYSLIRLFKLYERGEVFSLNNAKCIRLTGWLLLARVIVDPFYQVLITLVASWHNPPGHRYIAISTNSVSFILLLTALSVLLISWVMVEAAKLKETQDYTV
jgi:hypothetical protein